MVRLGLKRIAVVGLIAAVAGVGWMAYTLTREELPSHGTRRNQAADAQPEQQTARADAGTLRIHEGFAEVIDPKATPTTSTAAEPEPRYWYGLALDARTRLGEEGVPIEVEQLEDSQTWPVGRTLRHGVFVVRVPDELEPGKAVRLAFATHDGRLGWCAVQAPTDPSLDVGRVWLRSIERLHGRCVDTNGDAVAEVRISLRAIGELRVEGNEVAAAVSNEHGYFDIERLPRGLYVLEGRKQFGDGFFLHAPLAVPHPDLLIVAERASEALTLIVRDSIGEPVPGAVVTARLRGPDPTVEALGAQNLLSPVAATTDESGTAWLRHQHLGRYRVDVQVGHDGFRFKVDLVRGGVRNRILIVPADPRVVLRFMLRDGRPAAQMPLQIETLVGALKTTTDGDGILRVARGTPPLFRVSATTFDNTLTGATSIRHTALREGQVARVIELAPPKAEAQGPHAIATMPRSAIVHTPDGLPVRGASFGGGPRIARSNREGRAALGPMPAESAIRLLRNDLASGNPTSGELGSLEQASFVWRRGVQITLTVTDAFFGFPIDRSVRIGINEKAWKRIGPGRFRALFDPLGITPPGQKLVVRAPGYAWLELDWPTGDGPQDVEAKLLRPGAGDTATVSLLVRKRNASLTGARIEGKWLGRVDRNGIGKFVALSAEDGRLVVTGLKPGRWMFQVSAGFHGSGRTSAVLAPDRQELNLQIGRGPTHAGFVLDDRGRPVEGAEVEMTDPVKQHARTRRDGKFAFNRATRGPVVKLRATKVGYTPATQEWKRERTGWKRPPIRLARTIQLYLPIKWRDGGSGAIPSDLRFEFVHIEEEFSTRIPTNARISNDHLNAYNIPRGKIRVTQLGGSAYVPTFTFTYTKQGSPTISLLRGVTVRGRVHYASGDGAGILVSVASRGRTPRSLRTARGGLFEVRGLAPGRIDIEVEGQTPASRKSNHGRQAANGDKLDVVVSR